MTPGRHSNQEMYAAFLWLAACAIHPSLPTHEAEGINGNELAARGLHYNGWQEGCGSVPGGHLYSCIAEPWTTFVVMPGESLHEAYKRALVPFGRELAEAARVNQ
jgi:hypothetical protein